jgi:hypothetical protein
MWTVAKSAAMRTTTSNKLETHFFFIEDLPFRDRTQRPALLLRS